MVLNPQDKIFVTGATGFLGSSLTRLLVERGLDVTILVRPASDHPFLGGLPLARVKGDITDYASVLRGMKDCTHVFHVAGYLSYHKLRRKMLRAVNVEGTENVCRAALENGVKRLLVVSSTSAVGIPEDPRHPADETFPFHRRWKKVPYMLTKRLSEEAALGFVGKGLDVVVVNPSTFYGPGDVKLHTGEVFRNIASGLLKIAPPGGNGVISIRDCAEGLVAAMEKGRTGERYILNSDNLTILEIFNVLAGVLEMPPIRKRFPRWTYPPFYAAAFLVENVFRMFGKASKIECGTIAMGWRYRYFDSSKARRELGWSPRVTFEETCRQALEFYRGQGLLP
jgi:dihydroflavonol-4-reductase